MQIGPHLAKLWRFIYFQDGVRPPSWILREVVLTPSSLLWFVFLQLNQIWLYYLIACERYDQNNFIQYGRRHHLEFTSGLHCDTFSRLGKQNASAYQISKFRANRSIFREVMTFHIFSRRLPSAIFNFEKKIKFWINFRGRSQSLRRQTKFGQNRINGGRDIAIKPKSNMAAAAMLNLM